MSNVLKSQAKCLLSSVAVPVLLAGLVTMLIAATLYGAGPTGAQTPPPDPGHPTLFGSMTSTTSIPTVTPAPIQAKLPGCWFVDDKVAYGTGFSSLKAVDGKESNNVWAVGSYTAREKPQALTAHWDGATWSRVPAPTIENGSFLSGVSVISKDDVWAVGVQGSTITPPMRVLILHWDGRIWTEVATPNLSNNISELEDVVAISADDVWAVGYIEPFMGSIGGKQAIILHWDGLAWTQVTTPAISPKEERSGYSTLESLAVLSKNDIWAVGAGTDGFGPMALHWDGTGWSRASMPAVRGLLHGVTAIAPDDIWAVGNKYREDNRGIDTLTMHWDGTTWSVIPSPGNSGTDRAEYWLDSVEALAKNDVWAVGYVTFSRTQPMMLLLRWDGRAWNSVGKPPLSVGWYESDLNSITNVSGSIWMAGVNGTGVLLRYNASPCAATPTPTPIVPLNPPVPVPGNGTRLFPETGKTMTGLFLDYWNAHGGLPQQGYPISEVIGEVSDLNQGLYTMQYTERAVFEFHPDKAKPYDVLLSQLGTFQYRKKYPGGAPNQKPNNDPGSIFFKETGKRMGGSFLEYWQANGGLMQQGYPISDEFVEVSPLDRKPYTVQYFERVVFEYHPENPKPYDVLLSHRGRFRWDEKYTGGAPGQKGMSECWESVQVPLDTGITGLSDISALPNGEAWAVGERQVNGVGQTLILRFRDKNWALFPSPNPGMLFNALGGVAALASNDVWAVGAYANADGTGAKSLVLHWDGKEWKIIPSPNPGGSGNLLYSISALAPDDIWAVGATIPTNSSGQPFLLHWDGRTWTERPALILVGSSGAQSVVAISHDDVWVTGDNNGTHLMVMHWDGREWTTTLNLEKTLNLPDYDVGQLRDVAAVGPNDVWAVGYYRKYSYRVETITLHWDGLNWTRVPNPSRGRIGTANDSGILSGVSAIARDNVWAVGSWGANDVGAVANEPLILHWDGKQWNIDLETKPAGVAKASLQDVSARTDGIWTAGAFGSATVRDGGLVTMRNSNGLCVER
ncbi:MAG: hypothetical protein ABIO92_02425 [Chloroflexia bacterium]